MITIKQKNQEAELTLAYRDHEKGLSSHAFYKTHDQAISEDLVQETFMKTWNYLVKRGKIEMMKAFLYHVLNNLIVDQYRKHKTTSLNALTEKGFEPSIDYSEQLVNMFDGKKAVILIDSLPEKYQKVMRMRYIQDLSIKEITLLVGQTKNAITVQLHRGLEKLKVLYEQTA